jgi:tetratricopeptide (TPR) repeat protein
MLPLRRFGRRKKEGLEGAAGAGLPDRVRGEAAKGDVSLDSDALAAAVLHYDDAIASLDSASEPGRPDAIAAAEIYLKRGQALLRQSHAAVVGGPAGSISDYHIGIELGRRAIGDFTEAIRLNPSLAAAYCMRGEARVQTSRCERGTKSFRRASQYLAEALEDFTQALALEPALAAAYAGRAVAHAALGQDIEADADVESAVVLGADAAALRQTMRVWRQQTSHF